MDAWLGCKNGQLHGRDTKNLVMCDFVQQVEVLLRRTEETVDLQHPMPVAFLLLASDGTNSLRDLRKGNDKTRNVQQQESETSTWLCANTARTLTLLVNSSRMLSSVAMSFPTCMSFEELSVDLRASLSCMKMVKSSSVCSTSLDASCKH